MLAISDASCLSEQKLRVASDVDLPNLRNGNLDP
jgi:hypothetical protein